MKLIALAKLKKASRKVRGRLLKLNKALDSRLDAQARYESRLAGARISVTEIITYATEQYLEENPIK